MNCFRLAIASLALVSIVTTLSAFSCTGSDITGPAPAQTGEAYCGSQPLATYGKLFFCGTSQANLQTPGLPSGYRGYCMLTDENLGLVGYSAYTFSGGAFPVRSQSHASANCALIGNQCAGYIMCTRVP